MSTIKHATIAYAYRDYRSPEYNRQALSWTIEDNDNTFYLFRDSLETGFYCGYTTAQEKPNAQSSAMFRCSALGN